MMLPAGPGIRLTRDELEVLNNFVDGGPSSDARDLVREMLRVLDAMRGVDGGEAKIVGSDADPTVNHPAHYGGEDNPFEVVKVLEAWLTPAELLGWLKGSAIKYLARMGKKHGQPAARDAAKAEWYANRIKGMKTDD